MLIIATSISGSGRKDYLKTFEKEAVRQGKSVKIYQLGEMIFEHAAKVGINITQENVLNANPNVINSLRSAVFEIIKGSLPETLKRYDAVIINMHSFFFWKKIFMRAFDRYYINELNPDMFVTFIDDAPDIKKRLDARDQWKSENITQEEILLWQNVEVEVTASWSDLKNRPFYVISVSQPPTTLTRLIFNPEIEPIYVSMPMSHLPDKDQIKVTRLIEFLEKHFVVFEPRKIDKSALNNQVDPVVYNQTVARDLYWLIKQSKKIIAYFPRLVSSPGVINELREGYETNKDVWLIYPEKVASPFLTYFCSRLFNSENQFRTFLEKEYKK